MTANEQKRQPSVHADLNTIADLITREAKLLSVVNLQPLSKVRSAQFQTCGPMLRHIRDILEACADETAAHHRERAEHAAALRAIRSESAAERRDEHALDELRDGMDDDPNQGVS